MMELRPVRGHGSWRHAAFHVSTTIATPAAYAPLPFALASLGWPAGVATLVAGTIVTYYSSILLASLWEWDGVSHVRYRDLARSIFVIQIAGCYQIYCRPTYQYLEGKLLDEAKGVFSCRNWASRLLVTGLYMGVITLTAAALPFFGDFVALCGAFGFTPLDFIIPAIAYLLVRRPTNPLVVMLNLGMAVTYLIVAMLGSVGAIRFIAVDASTYRFFRDL